jgi:hypothetical protein
MTASILSFDPSELQVLEDNIEFDELIQRPETIRFYTVQEQTTDAFEKLVPKGKITRFQREQVQREVDRLKDLYDTFVVPMPENYQLREPEFARVFPWVHPIYATPDYKPYRWSELWTPLFDDATAPNYYNRLLAALPRPYADTSTGAPYPVTTRTEFTTREGLKPHAVLPPYEMTRTRRNDDKTIDILRVPVAGTEDVPNFTGYFLEARTLAVPNPLPEHPFLKSNESTVLDTTAPLADVVPTLDAILTHGVPPTKDPYTEATPFLKLYDVKLSDIPWSAWKVRFPPHEMVQAMPQPEPLPLPKSDQLAPPEKLLSIYKSVYGPGISVRKWLIDQLDGGGLIVDLLRSEVIDNGTVESIPGVDLPTAAYPATTVEECNLGGLSFQDFQIKGVLRRTIVLGKDPLPDKITLQCVPLEFVKQERARQGYTGRLPWKETTQDEMKKAYLTRLEEVRPLKILPKKESAPPVTPARPESLRRNEVLVVQADPNRYAEDKVRDIQELLRETVSTNNIYTDPDGLFVFCGHSIALLAGDLAKDRLAFYDKWSARVDGYRVCRFCGEHINDDVEVEQDEYDEDGRKLNRAEELEQTGFMGHDVATYATGLAQLRPLFMMESAHDNTVFLMVSLLQVLPSADRLEDLLKLGRQTAAVQFAKGTASQIAQFSGAMGLATTALLLQTHVPTLVPRRSFGSRPLVLSGYPRDAETPADVSIVDSLFMVLRKTFEQFPTSFRGPAQGIVRAVLNAPSPTKTQVLAMLGPKSPLYGRKDSSGRKEPSIVPALLDEARAHLAGAPKPVETPMSLIPVVLPPKDLDTIKTFPACPTNRPIWTSGRPPKVVQVEPPLRVGLLPAQTARALRPVASPRVVPKAVPKAEIRTLLSAAPANVTIKDPYRANLLLAERLGTLSLSPSDIASVDPAQAPAELRDLARGLVAQQLGRIRADASKRTQYEASRFKDIALYMLSVDYKEQRAEVNKLRASERLKFIQRMAGKSDQEREVIGALLRIGLAPYIISNQDRELFAREAELLQEELARQDDMFEATGDLSLDTGVGAPRDYHDDGDEDENVPVGSGDYGDQAGLPEGRDYQQPGFGDDRTRSI